MEEVSKYVCKLGHHIPFLSQKDRKSVMEVHIEFVNVFIPFSITYSVLLSNRINGFVI